MDLLPLHPKLVHVPIALAVLMPALAGGLLVAWWRGALPRRAWVIAVALQAVLVAGSVAALRTGEADEERVERVVSERVIEQHEEAAERFTWAAGVVLVLAAAATVVRRDRSARRLAAVATLGTLCVTILGYRTGQAGGHLVYRDGAASAWAAGAGGKAAGGSAPRAGQDDD